MTPTMTIIRSDKAIDEIVQAIGDKVHSKPATAREDPNVVTTCKGCNSIERRGVWYPVESNILAALKTVGYGFVYDECPTCHGLEENYKALDRAVNAALFAYPK